MTYIYSHPSNEDYATKFKDGLAKNGWSGIEIVLVDSVPTNQIYLTDEDLLRAKTIWKGEPKPCTSFGEITVPPTPTLRRTLSRWFRRFAARR